jgi:hypothetical protein
MPSPPSITIRVRPFGELAPPGGGIDQTPLFLGTSEAGPLYEPGSAGSLQGVIDVLGARGHLVDVAARYFARNGSGTFRWIRLDGSVAGTASAVTHTGTGATLTLTGSTHHQTRTVRVEVLDSADVDEGTARIRVSLDAFGVPDMPMTWAGPYVVPATGILPIPGTGIVLNFADAEAFVAGDVYEFSTRAAHYSGTEVALATPAIQSAAAGAPTFLVYTGHPVDATAGGGIVDAIETQLETLLGDLQPTGVMVSIGTGSDASIIAALTSRSFVDAPFASVGAHSFYVVDARGLPGVGYVALPESDVAGVEAARSAISTDLGRYANGPLGGVAGATYDMRTAGSALYQARVSVPRTYSPALGSGWYIAGQLLLTPAGSDFVDWQHAAVMIAGLRTLTRTFVVATLLEGLRQTSDLTMDPSDVAIVEGACDLVLADRLLAPTNVRGLPGHVSAVAARVSRTELLPNARVDLRIRPLGYAKWLTISALFARTP